MNEDVPSKGIKLKTHIRVNCKMERHTKCKNRLFPSVKFASGLNWENSGPQDFHWHFKTRSHHTLTKSTFPFYQC